MKRICKLISDWMGVLVLVAALAGLLFPGTMSRLKPALINPLLGVIMFGIDFEGKGNPLTKAGIIFSVNQILYILIALWVFAAVPEKMLMVYAMIFGAHLMPFSWLYQSKSYLVLSIVIPVLSLVLGLKFPPFVLAAVMVFIEALFAFLLYRECRTL